MSAVPKPQCKAANRYLSGRCRSAAMGGSDYCWTHADYVASSRPFNHLIAVHVDDAHANWVKREAKAVGITMSEWLRRLIEREKIRSEKR